jgi:hypothetical protein
VNSSQRNIASEYITSIDAARKKNDTATLYRLKDEIQKKIYSRKDSRVTLQNAGR